MEPGASCFAAHSSALAGSPFSLPSRNALEKGRTLIPVGSVVIQEENFSDTPSPFDIAGVETSFDNLPEF